MAARGLDIPEVQHVVNFDMPKDVDEYVHRQVLLFQKHEEIVFFVNFQYCFEELHHTKETY